MINTTVKMLKTAHILDSQIIDAAMDENQEWELKKQMLNRIHESVHDIIDILIMVAVAEGVERETLISELTDETKED